MPSSLDNNSMGINSILTGTEHSVHFGIFEDQNRKS